MRWALVGTAASGDIDALLDTALNDTQSERISDIDITGSGATVRTMVITAREDLRIAREGRRVLTG